MNITDIRITKFKNPQTRALAVVSIVVDDAVAIHDIKIIDGANGLFVAMPSKPNNNPNCKNKFMDVVHPINPEVREFITNIILKKFCAEYFEGKDESTC